MQLCAHVGGRSGIIFNAELIGGVPSLIIISFQGLNPCSDLKHLMAL